MGEFDVLEVYPIFAHIKLFSIFEPKNNLRSSVNSKWQIMECQGRFRENVEGIFRVLIPGIQPVYKTRYNPGSDYELIVWQVI